MDATDAARLKIDGEEYEIPSMADWTLAEAETVEDILGCPVEQANPASKRTIRALAWLAMHRADPTVTPDDLGSIRLGGIAKADVAAVIDEEVVPVPPEVGGAHESQNGSAETTNDDSEPVTHPPVHGPQLLPVSTD